MRYPFVFLLTLILLSSCIEVQNNYSQLPPGPWRGVLKLTNPVAPISAIQYEDDEKLSEYFELPFNFEVVYENDSMKVFFINAEERLEAEKVLYGRDPRTAMDTVEIIFETFDSHMDGFYEENTIEGKWVVNYRDNYSIPFIAEYGKTYRFEEPRDKPATDITGEWYAEFEYGTEDSYPAIAELTQEGSRVTGTFKTETGDYRYLEGNMDGSKLNLSVFDGAHAFLFTAKLESDTLYGEFRSGKHYVAPWKAVRKTTQSLRDPYLISKSNVETISGFRFPDTKGDTLDLDDNSHAGKIKLINIMGTWCPNCRDEINFLKEIDESYADSNIEIISLAFERYRSSEKAMEQLKKYKENIQFDWPLLYGGFASKAENSRQLDFLDQVYSYPTLLVVDGTNRIRYIHTGFYGPATSEYQEFRSEFRSKLEDLLNQK